MRFQLKLTHKLGGAFAVLLICALALGGMAQYSLHTLSKNMEERTALDAVLELGQKAQAAVYDWLVHREELAMAAKDPNQLPPQLQTYQELSEKLLATLDTFETRSADSVDKEMLAVYDKEFRRFSASFGAYRQFFYEGVAMVKGLREASVGILAKAQSLQKAIDRKGRKLRQNFQKLRDGLQRQHWEMDGVGSDATQQLIILTQDLQKLGEQRAVTAILRNKPLAFQEMAKDFILYKDETSGSGLILEMGQLLGINADATMGQTFKQYSGLFVNKREAKLYAQIIALTRQYFDAFKQYFDLNAKMKKAMNEMWSAQKTLREQVSTIRNEAAARYRQQQETAAMRMGVLSLVAVIISLLFITLSITMVVMPIRGIIGQIGATCFQIASGSQETLQHIRRNSADELGDLARCFNELLHVFADNSKEIAQATARAEQEARTAQEALESLQQAQEKAESARKEGMLDAVRALERIVSNLVQTSDSISTQVSDASSQAVELQRRTSESSLSLNEMGASIQAVASSSSMAALNADEVMSTAHKGAGVVQGAIDAIFQVRSQTDALKSSLAQLSSQARSINEIMTVINDIADQTNLLALNAAIEAARAGDAGRGFAVVADEVRKLAEKTMQATTDVEQAINAIQSSAETNVEGMVRAEEAVLGSTDLARQAGTSLKEIVSLVEESANQVRNIAAAAEQQSVSSEQITEATVLVSTIAQDMAKLMERSDNATAGLLQLAGELRSLIEGLRDECAESEADVDGLALQPGQHGFAGAA